MGIFKSLMGIDKHEGAINAVLANHLITTCGADLARRIVRQIASIQMAMEMEWERLSEMRLRSSIKDRESRRQISLLLRAIVLGYLPTFPATFSMLSKTPSGQSPT